MFLPAFNEVDNLEGAVADIVWAASEVLTDYEILIIDDGSTDGTGALADRLAPENPRIRAIHQPTNMGIAAAYERALREARLDYFSFLAADGEIARESVRDILGSVGRADIVAPYHQNPAGPPGPSPLPDLGVDRPRQRAVPPAHALLPGPLHLSGAPSRGPCPRARAASTS